MGLGMDSGGPQRFWKMKKVPQNHLPPLATSAKELWRLCRLWSWCSLTSCSATPAQIWPWWRRHQQETHLVSSPKHSGCELCQRISRQAWCVWEPASATEVEIVLGPRRAPGWICGRLQCTSAQEGFSVVLEVSWPQHQWICADSPQQSSDGPGASQSWRAAARLNMNVDFICEPDQQRPASSDTYLAVSVDVGGVDAAPLPVCLVAHLCQHSFLFPCNSSELWRLHRPDAV